MASNNATSVSKGCFAYKGKNKRANINDYLDASGDTLIKTRLKHYQSLWDDLHVQIDILRSDLNSKIFDDLIAFVASCHKDRMCSIKRPIGEIPTAALITGINTPDHDIMFSNLYGMLKANVTPFVARVKSQDCGHVAQIISSIILQFTNTSAANNDEEEEVNNMDILAGDSDKTNLERSPVKLSTAVRRRRTVTMATLVKTYQQMCTTEHLHNLSPPKKARVSGSQKKCNGLTKNEGENGLIDIDETKPHHLVVIMLEDAENINSSVLQDFISLCSSYLASLPVVLVLGIATAVTAIHQLLPSSIISLLCIEKFQAPPASGYLAHLMEKVVMTPNVPFKLGPKVFNFLLDIFFYHDFSILNFIMGFQMSMIEHYLTNPLSLFCCNEAEIDTVTSRLTKSQLEDIRRQPAFMRYVEGKPGPSQIQLLTDDSATKKHLAEEVKAMHLFHLKVFPVLHFLHILGSNLPKLPLGKHFRELYSVLLIEDVCSSEGYNEAFNLLRVISSHDLCERLSLCQEALTETKDKLDDIRHLHHDVEKFIYRLQHLDEEQDNDNQTGSGNDSVQGRILPLRAKLHELKETLQSMSSRKKKSPYERVREEVLDTLHNYFKILLVCPMAQPLHEIFYFNNVAAIRDQIKAAPRCSIQRALIQPEKYLNCPCCQCDVDAILPTMPDVCIAYKLHLECGTLVNLYDWLQSFVTVVESKCRDSKQRAEKYKPNIELRARFIRAVSELQFLGFIKSTRRKTDHVARLTW